MQQATRRALVARIREYIDSGTTAMAPQVFRNPLKAYASPERLAQEQSTLFRDFPLLLGLSCDLRNPGDFLTDDYSGVPLLLVRQADGALLGMPGAAGFEGVDRDACALQRVAVEEKYGMVWAVPNPVLARQPVDIDRHLGALAAEYDSYGFAGYHHFATKVLEPRINWKMGIDGFLESYHLRVLHPETVGPLYFNNLATADGFGFNHRMVAVRKSFAEQESDQVLEDDFLRYTNVLYTLFPNTMFVYQIDHLEVWRLFPDGNNPNRSKMVLSMYVPEPVASDSAARHWNNNLRLAVATVEGEDLALGERIQRGYDSGTLRDLIYGRNEPALAHFHASLESAMGIER